MANDPSKENEGKGAKPEAEKEGGDGKEGGEDSGPMILSLPSGLEEKNRKKWLIESGNQQNAIAANQRYSVNTTQEEETLEVVEDFRRQFVQLFPSRQPLLLFPYNECGVQKFISTTVSPSLQSATKLYDLEKCATFVADYLEYYTLDNPVKLPSIIPSSQTVLELRAGDCFDFAILLASLLKGCEYSAYCVSGYAPKWITEQSLETTHCPSHVKFPDMDTAQSQDKKGDKGDGKYVVKTKKMHITYYEKKKAAKDKEMAKRLADRDKAAALAKIEKKIDNYAKDRVHCWVLIKAGRRGIKEDLFVEATTGIVYAIKDAPYVGIETVWDETNCWVNMQGPKHVEGLSYDLNDKKKWENVLVAKTPPSDPRPSTGKASSRPGTATVAKDKKSVSTTPTKAKDVDAKKRVGSEEVGGEKKSSAEIPLDVLDVPRSWCRPPLINKERLQNPYPKFCKSTSYVDCLVEKYKEYEENVLGLVQKVTMYEIDEDTEEKSVEMVVEHFKHREDRMTRRIIYHKVKKEVQEYEKGCKCLDGLAELTKIGDSKIIYKFHPNQRKDGMLSRTWTENCIFETYQNRDDFLISRLMRFKSGDGGGKNPFVLKLDGNEISLTMLTEKYARNPSKDADADVETRTHWTRATKREVMQEYHLDDSSIIRKCLVYNLKSDSQLQLNNPMHKCPESKLPTRNEQLTTVFELVAREKHVFNEVSDRERAFLDLDEQLNHYAENCPLEKDLFDAAQDQVDEMAGDNEIMEDENEEREKIDPLAPFLVSFPNQLPRNRKQAMTARLECLQSLKEKLLERATIIQNHLDREQEALKTRSTHYNRMQSEDPEEKKAAEEEFKKYSEEIMFRLSILDARLKRHEKFAIKEYSALDKALTHDPRLKALHEARG